MFHFNDEASANQSSLIKIKLFSALREKFREGYHFPDFKADLMAGIIVGMVATPLGMALAIASGVAPQYGLYTVIIGGGVVALLGGSRFQVTGPTAAFVVILAPITQKFGLSGLLIAGLMSGVLLVLMGIMQMGKLIQYIPHPVITGFTSGIAVVIATLQLKDFFGLTVLEMPEQFFKKIEALYLARGTASLTEFLIGMITLLFLVTWPRFNKKIPAPLVALTLMSLITAILKHLYPNLLISTIGSKFSYNINGVAGYGIPQSLPNFTLPWNFINQNGNYLSITYEVIEELLPGAFAIALLGAIESLLSAVIADGMTQTKHDSDGELVALGIGNIICPFFGAIPVTGAIARTATNIRFGAKSPLSSVFHALFTLFVLIIFAPYVSYLPMASLAALLLLIAYNISEMKHFTHILKVAPKSDVIVLLVCFLLTVFFDMVMGVTVGVVLAALLFMRNMSHVTEASKIPSHQILDDKLNHWPHDFVLYEIGGPLFFGAAEKATSTFTEITDQIKGVVFIMKDVLTLDITGFIAFESALQKLLKTNRKVFLVGLRKQPSELILKSKLLNQSDHIIICNDLNEVMSKI